MTNPSDVGCFFRSRVGSRQKRALRSEPLSFYYSTILPDRYRMASCICGMMPVRGKTSHPDGVRVCACRYTMVSRIRGDDSPVYVEAFMGITRCLSLPNPKARFSRLKAIWRGNTSRDYPGWIPACAGMTEHLFPSPLSTFSLLPPANTGQRTQTASEQ